MSTDESDCERSDAIWSGDASWPIWLHWTAMVGTCAEPTKRARRKCCTGTAKTFRTRDPLLTTARPINATRSCGTTQSRAQLGEMDREITCKSFEPEGELLQPK